MTHLDGLYRNAGTTVTWDAAGVTFGDGSHRRRVAWSQVDGVRRIGKSPGFVQVIVRGHVPPGDPALDPFSVGVASEADANRLVTTFSWTCEPLPAI